MNEANPGRLRRVDPSALDDDPFWSVVRRRHPDVDVVVLPPPGGQPSVPSASVDEVRSATDAAVAAWRLVRPVLVAATAAEPSVRWGRGPYGDALLIEIGVTGLGQAGGTDLLRALALRLGEARWSLRPATRDGNPVLEARDGQIDLSAVAGPGATVLTLATNVLPVTAEDRSAVAAEVREAVASWQ